ncbi:MAG: response regulator [Thermoanaerobacteraceae bacterium]|nr:response regulator [Thermoanaerobacteraceae bacterium]
MRVLIIEDNDLNLELLLAILEQLDLQMELLTATDGRQGWEIFQKEGPDLVFLDMQLPVVDGFILAGRMKQAHPQTVIVGITAYAMTGDRERVLASGCDHYLAKPVTPAAVRNLLSQLLE